MGRVLVVFHCEGGNTRSAAEALAKGARAVVIKEALQADTHDLLSCDAIAVGTPDYFRYMAGGLKDLFDRTSYPTQGNVTDKPCGVFVTHGGGRALESVKAIRPTFKFKIVDEPVLVNNASDAKARKKLAHLGRLQAESSRAGSSGAYATC